MRVCFLSEKPGMLFANGILFGRIDGFERSAEIPENGVYFECRAAGYLPVSFRLDEESLFAPPPSVKLYFSENGVAVCFCDFVRADPTLSVIRQERIGNSRLTLCMQGKLQLNLENETGFHIVELPERLSDCTFCACGEGYLLEGADCFLLLSRDGTVLVRENGRVKERGERLEAEIVFGDSVGHTATCAWERGRLVSSTIRAAHPPTEETFALAFFESVHIGADCEEFLDRTLRPKKGLLKEFLGDFEACVFYDPLNIGLVYRERERVYSVRRYRVTLTDGKISNLTTP